MKSSEVFINNFLTHREVTNQLIEKIDRDNYDYKPTPTSMEAHKLADHILKSLYTFAQLAHQQNPEPLFSEEDTTPLTERAKRYTEETIRLVTDLSDEQLSEVLNVKHMLGRDIPAGALLQLGLDHEIHHKGQLFVYVRGMGNTELPFYVKFE
ncbi:DinB family protein [Halobacillus rhizosphaerae]|uniref:DinB family protein n=1 Tax=Halobacillus rhizosphaerae TaxID=3064889 RepID=UPI00398AED93